MKRPWLDNALDRWQQSWSVRRVLFTAGIIASITVAVALALPVWIAPPLALLLAVTLLFPWFRRPLWLVCAVTAAAFLLITAAYRDTHIRPLSALTGQTDTITGQVIATPTNGSLYTLRVTDSALVPAGTRVALHCPSEVAPNLYDTVTAQVELLCVEDASFRYSSTDTYLFAFLTETEETGIRVTDPKGFSPVHWLAPLRQRLLETLRAVVPGEEGAVLAALCLGDRTDLSSATTTAFRNSGLTHLLVVSGLHLALVAATIRRLLRPLGFRLSAVLTMPFVLAFMLLVGFTPSVCRAGVMCLVWLGSYLVSRRPDGLNSLGLSTVILLAVNPYTLYNAGFQLSFMATAGILLIAPRLMRRFPPMEATHSVWVWAGWRIRYYVAGLLAACAGALLFTLPISCYYFGGFALLLPVANLLMMAPAGWALLTGWLGALLCLCPFLTWLGQPLLYGAGIVSRYLTWAADLFGPGWAFVPMRDLWQMLLLIALCLLLAVGIRQQFPWQRVTTACLTLLVLAVAVCYPLTAAVTRLSVIRADTTTALLVQKGGCAALLMSHSANLEDMPYHLQRLGCVRLDALVIAAGEPMDVSRLEQLTAQTGNPPVYTGDTRLWETFSDAVLTRLTAGETLSLWQGCGITRQNETWWRVETPGGSAILGVDTETAPPQTADLTVYTALPAALPEGYCVLTCRENQLAKQQPELTNVYWLSQDSITYITRAGKKWSVSPWL